MKSLYILAGILIFSNFGCSKKVIKNPKQENATQNEVSDPYGTQSTSKYTGSAGTTKKQEANVNLDLYLAKIAGVLVTGQGASATVRVRGYASLGGGSGGGDVASEPLFVLNGNVFNGGFTALYYSLNSNDIKSVTALKDASSTSIYGSRGANGVILINLRKTIKD